MKFSQNVIAQVPNGRYFVLNKGKAQPLGVDKLKALSMANGMVLYWKNLNGNVEKAPSIALPKKKEVKPVKKVKIKKAKETVTEEPVVEAVIQGLTPHPSGHVQFRVPGGVTRANAHEGNGCGIRTGGLTPEAEEKGFRIIPSLAETLSQKGASTGGAVLIPRGKDLHGKY